METPEDPSGACLCSNPLNLQGKTQKISSFSNARKASDLSLLILTALVKRVTSAFIGKSHFSLRYPPLGSATLC